MTHMPKAFPKQSSQHIVLFEPDRRGTDFERVEDIAADAIAAAREAAALLQELPYEIFKPMQAYAEILRKAVERRKMLTDEVRLTIEEMLRQVARAEADDATASLIDRMMRRLRDALEGSHRVADLLAAERDIGWHRGIRQ